MSNDRAWLVLIAGEDASRSRKGLHCSLSWIGKAYAQHVDYFGRDHVIVIANLQEVTTWLEEASRLGEPRYSDFKTQEESAVCWGQVLQSMNTSCSRLIADGGADYDFDTVNPSTVMRVLMGDGRGSEKVIPKADGGTVLLGIFSHGWSHTTTDAQFQKEYASILEHRVRCDVCGRPHEGSETHEHSSLATREWFVHLPYQTPEVDRHMYEFTSYQVPKDPHSLLYSQHLVQAYHALVMQSPSRRIVSVYNFCGSGGVLKFFLRWSSRSEAYKKLFNVDTWPICFLTASTDMEGAISDLFGHFFDTLAEYLTDPTQRKRPFNDLWLEVERRYYCANPCLFTQVIQIRDPCLMCQTFNGSNAGLCSVCHKKYHELPKADRPNLSSSCNITSTHAIPRWAGDLQQSDAARPMGNAAGASCSSGCPPARATPNQALQMCADDAVMLAAIEDLFPRPLLPPRASKRARRT